MVTPRCPERGVRGTQCIFSEMHERDCRFAPSFDEFDAPNPAECFIEQDEHHYIVYWGDNSWTYYSLEDALMAHHDNLTSCRYPLWVDFENTLSQLEFLSANATRIDQDWCRYFAERMAEMTEELRFIKVDWRDAAVRDGRSW